MTTGDLRRSEGPRCRGCKATEARCASTGGCCAPCSHWRHWTDDGEPISKIDERSMLVDPVTAKRREQWRDRYRRQRAS